MPNILMHLKKKKHSASSSSDTYVFFCWYIVFCILYPIRINISHPSEQRNFPSQSNPEAVFRFLFCWSRKNQSIINCKSNVIYHCYVFFTNEIYHTVKKIQHTISLSYKHMSMVRHILWWMNFLFKFMHIKTILSNFSLSISSK